MQTRKTLLFFGEGLVGERVYLEHIKLLCANNYADYDPLQLSVSIDCDRGGTPTNVLKEGELLVRERSYDRCIVVMDDDLQWPEVKSKISSTEMVYIACSPCLEGHILELLGESVPATSQECKRKLFGRKNRIHRKHYKGMMRDRITWDVVQQEMSRNRIIKCIVDHYNISTHINYTPGDIVS